MLKVLIVDDEYLIRNGIANGLDWNDMGFEVIGVAANGQEALVQINRQLPDVVITDVRMPIMDGIELCKNIRLQHPHIQIIILSGYSEFEYAQKAIEYGVHAYILKPLKEEELKHVLNKIRAEYKGRRTNVANPSEATNNIQFQLYEKAEAVFIHIIQDNSVDISACRKKLCSLGIDLAEESMYTIAFACDIKNRKSQVDWPNSQILQFSRRHWHIYNFPVLYINHYFYILFNHKKKPTHYYLTDLLKDFTNSIQKYLANLGYEDVVLSFGISNFFRGLENFKTSIYEAQQALQYKFYLGIGTIIAYKDIQTPAKQSIDKVHLDMLIEQLANALIDLDKNCTIRTTKSILKLLANMKILDVQILFIKCLQIYNFLIQKLKKENIKIETLKEEELYHTIAQAQTFDDLSDKLENTIMYLFNKTLDFQNSSTNQQLVQKIKKYVREHYHEKLSLTQLSEVFYLNPSYISTLFKEETGINLFDYIFEVRMEEAKKLLKNSDSQIQTIAAQVGYSDFRHFCTVFKKATGLTPLQYRLNTILE